MGGWMVVDIGIKTCRMKRAILVLPVLVPLLLVGTSAATNMIASVGSDSEGPIFVNLSGLIADTTPRTEPVPFSFVLELSVLIWDPNGMDMAIGSYKNSTDSTWANVTMTYMGNYTLNNSEYTEVYHYHANATTFLLDPDHRLKVWNVKYYARNTLGRWNVSDTVNYSYCALYDIHSSTVNDTALPAAVGGALAVFVVLALSVSYVRRRP
jgi:hypothetical protein